MTPTAAVVILCQPSETAATALTLRHLVRDQEPTTSIHVLVNGGFAGELEAIAPRSPMVSFYSSPTNLGVAGGRNFLLRRPGVQAADVIVILDNDVITPPDHVGRLVEAVTADPEAGVVGSAVLDLRAASAALGVSGADLDAPITNERLARLPRLDDEAMWFHLGTHQDWWSVYFDELRIERRLQQRAGAPVELFPAMNHQDPTIRASIAEGADTRIPASNVAGCCQAFRRDLLDEIGYLMEEFSPYGYEDVDFCIRAAAAGRRNYIDPTILMLHGTDRRHSDRTTAGGVLTTHRNLMRCKTLLAWRHANATWPVIVERLILRRYLLARQTGHHRAAAEHLRAHVAGSLDARRQIRHATAESNRPR
jgi:GT2 family glycosyltransferase